MKRLLSTFRRDNRGAGIVTVLVTMLFISALGTALLFLSYTGYQMKLSERESKQNFYSADTAMSQVRAGVEQAVTKSLGNAYTDVLENYSSLNQTYEDSVSGGTPLADSLDAYMKEQFQGDFKTELLDWQDSGESLFLQSQSGGDEYSYSPEVLLGFLNPPEGAQKTVDDGQGICRLTLPDGTAVELIGGAENAVTSDAKALTLKNVTLRYTAPNGFRTDIATDIVVTYPPFSYTPAAYSVSNISQFAMIAKTALKCVGSNLTLTGDAYAGAVTVDANGAGLTHSNGTLVSGGDVEADNSGEFSTSSDSNLWAKDILVGNAAVSLSGNTYVADDLTLAGEGANAVLTGNYYGFGYYPVDSSGSSSSSTDSGPSGSGSVASNSSSILVNGRNTSLDLGGLTSLMLAGNSFIDATGATSGSGSYITGQSLAARSDQLSYLVPLECLPEGIQANPYLAANALTGDQINSVMAKIQSLAKETSYYQYVGGVQAVYVQLNSTGSDKIAYLFLTFNKRADADAYFKGYFSQHSGDINGYLGKYLDFYSAPRSAMSGGALYSGSVSSGLVSGNGLTEPTSPATLKAVSAQYQTKYQNLCETLSESISSGTSESPYEYVVNTSKGGIGGLSDGGTDYFTDASGKTAAVIVKGDYNFPSDDPSGDAPKIILATGDVEVDQKFTGLILSGGTVTMKADIDSGSDVSAALQAVDSGGRTLLSYLNVGSNTGGAANGTSGGSWEVDNLVGYANWSRH